MERATLERLRAQAAAIGVALDAPALAKLDRYSALLLQWNRAINLTAITSEVEIAELHFLDSLAVLPLLGSAHTVLDVGSGAGFPGAVLAIARPTLRITCIDAVEKKTHFLRALSRELRLELTVKHQRLEDLDDLFDVALSRATFAPGEWIARGSPRVGPGGRLYAMLGSERPTLETPVGFTALPPVEYQLSGARRALVGFHRIP